MNCEQFDQNVLDVVHGMSSDEVKEAVLLHSKNCERCGGALAAIQGEARIEEPVLSTRRERIVATIASTGRDTTRERKGRWISVVGSYAMRPQVVMAVLLLLIVGTSLVLVRTKMDSSRMVNVSEDGVPSIPSGSPSVSMGALAASAMRANEETTEQAQAGNGKKGRSTEDKVLTPEDQDFANAMGKLRSKDYVGAFRAFDTLAESGGARADEAALMAARAVRASSGCKNALPRLEALYLQAPSSATGLQAKWEAAGCARILGDSIRARIMYRELAAHDAYRARAEKELGRLTPQGLVGDSTPAPVKSSDDP